MSDDAATTTAIAPTSPSFNLADFVHSDSFKAGAALALTYHGYARTGSVLWAIMYGLAGKWFPTIAVPVSLAQGYGERKPCP